MRESLDIARRDAVVWSGSKVGVRVRTRAPAPAPARESGVQSRGGKWELKY